MATLSSNFSQITYPYDFTYNGNPLVRTHGAADPDVHLWGDTIWLYCSQDHAPGYEAMDGYHAFSSTDMIHWTDHGEVLHSRDIAWGPSGWMWAPGAARKNGKYYLYYPHKDFSDNWRIGVAVSDAPEGPFKDIGAPLNGIGGIDPAIFIDDDGEAYIYNNNAIVAKLKPNMTELAESPKKINYDVTRKITDDYLEGFAEGSYMHKRNGIYYYSYSNWHNNEYQSFYAMGNNPYGPFEWKGPMAQKPQGAQDHHSVIEFENQWYYFYHIAVNGIPLIKDGQSRITCYDRLYYNNDGTLQIVYHSFGPTNLLTLSSSYGTIACDPPGRSYTPGTIVTLTAHDSIGFGFDSWSGDLAGYENPKQIKMDSDKNVTVNFIAVPTFQLTTSASNGSVSVEPPGGVYNEGTVVTLKAIDSFGYDFALWSGDFSGADNPISITMNEDKNVMANFLSVPTYILTINSNNGMVELIPPGGLYEAGQVVTLKASPDYSYGFTGWSGDLSCTENTKSISMDSDKSVDANFSYEGGGRIVFATNCGGSAYRSGDGINYSADKNYYSGGSYSTGSEIAGTTDDPLFQSERFGSSFSYNVNLPNGYYEVTLMFAEIFHSSSGSRIFNVSIENELVASNLDIYAKAGKNTSYQEKYGINLMDGQVNISLSAVKDNAKISAIKIFQPENPASYHLNTQSLNGTVVLDPPGGLYELDTKVTLTAIPDQWYNFTGWSGDLSGTENPTTIFMDGDKNVEANYAIPNFKLTTNTFNGFIFVYPSALNYLNGSKVSVRAIPKDGYEFKGWSGDLSGSDNPDTIIMDSDKSITAIFNEMADTEIRPISASVNCMLSQNYPNPTSGITTITYSLTEGADVKLVFYNLMGQCVAFVEEKYKTAGCHLVDWYPSDEKGNLLGEGVYFYQLFTDNLPVAVKRLIICK